MLTTPANGILLLSSLSFLTIGIVGWVSISDPDRSARLWLSAFVMAGLAPLLGAGAEMTSVSFIISTVSLTTSFALFGLSLKSFRNEKLSLREYALILAGLMSAYVIVLGYAFANGSIAVQATVFALGNGIVAGWATTEAMQLTKRTESRFASHLSVIFGIQAAVLFLRIPQVWLGEETRLSEPDPLALSIVLTLALCGIVKAISYYAMRLEEFQIRVQRDAEIVRDQALRLARKNTELVSAMHAAPVACAVTDPALKVIYLNAEARRLLGDVNLQQRPPRLADWLVGLQDGKIMSIASARYAFLRAPDWSEIRIAEISVRGIESDSPGNQWVFLIKPVEYTQSVIESIWPMIPGRDDHTMIITDDQGVGSSAQTGWGEVLGPYAVFNSPELRFGGISESRDAAGLDLWASLINFGGDRAKVDRARAEQRAGRGSSLLLRNAEGSQLNLSFTPIRSGSNADRHWLVEVFWKPAPSSATAPTRKAPASTVSIGKSETEESPPAVSTEVPAFLRKPPLTP